MTMSTHSWLGPQLSFRAVHSDAEAGSDSATTRVLPSKADRFDYSTREACLPACFTSSNLREYLNAFESAHGSGASSFLSYYFHLHDCLIRLQHGKSGSARERRKSLYLFERIYEKIIRSLERPAAQLINRKKKQAAKSHRHTKERRNVQSPVGCDGITSRNIDHHKSSTGVTPIVCEQDHSISGIEDENANLRMSNDASEMNDDDDEFSWFFDGAIPTTTPTSLPVDKILQTMSAELGHRNECKLSEEILSIIEDQKRDEKFAECGGIQSDPYFVAAAIDDDDDDDDDHHHHGKVQGVEDEADNATNLVALGAYLQHSIVWDYETRRQQSTKDKKCGHDQQLALPMQLAIAVADHLWGGDAVYGLHASANKSLCTRSVASVQQRLSEKRLDNLILYKVPHLHTGQSRATPDAVIGALALEGRHGVLEWLRRRRGKASCDWDRKGSCMHPSSLCAEVTAVAVIDAANVLSQASTRAAATRITKVVHLPEKDVNDIGKAADSDLKVQASTLEPPEADCILHCVKHLRGLGVQLVVCAVGSASSQLCDALSNADICVLPLAGPLLTQVAALSGATAVDDVMNMHSGYVGRTALELQIACDREVPASAIEAHYGVSGNAPQSVSRSLFASLDDHSEKIEIASLEQSQKVLLVQIARKPPSLITASVCDAQSHLDGSARGPVSVVLAASSAPQLAALHDRFQRCLHRLRVVCAGGGLVPGAGLPEMLCYMELDRAACMLTSRSYDEVLALFGEDDSDSEATDSVNTDDNNDDDDDDSTESSASDVDCSLNESHQTQSVSASAEVAQGLRACGEGMLAYIHTVAVNNGEDLQASLLRTADAEKAIIAFLESHQNGPILHAGDPLYSALQSLAADELFELPTPLRDFNMASLSECIVHNDTDCGGGASSRSHRGRQRNTVADVADIKIRAARHAIGLLKERFYL